MRTSWARGRSGQVNRTNATTDAQAIQRVIGREYTAG